MKNSPLRFLSLLWLVLVAALPLRAADAGAHQTYVIVHGAWGGGWAFREVDRLLTADGHKVYRPTLTGLGEKVHLANPGINLTTHIMDIVNVILFEDLHDVVLVGHSYGGMVITGVMDRVPDRIKRVIFLDATAPNDGESENQAWGRVETPEQAAQQYRIPEWVKPDSPLPHDVPQPAGVAREPVSFKNPAALKLPVTYILTVDPGKKTEDDHFYRFYERAKSRGWTLEIMEADHNVQWSNPKGLVERLENAVK